MDYFGCLSQTDDGVADIFGGLLVGSAWTEAGRFFEALLWLGLPGVTTALSWIFYYKALKVGDVATVALIDKGSVVVAMLLAWLVLREVITMRILIGAALIVAGLIVIARK